MPRGGARPGAGRKPSGKHSVQFWVTESEEKYLQKALEECRRLSSYADELKNSSLKSKVIL